MATPTPLNVVADACWNCARRRTDKPQHPSMTVRRCTSCLHFRFKDFSNR